MPGRRHRASAAVRTRTLISTFHPGAGMVQVGNFDSYGVPRDYIIEAQVKKYRGMRGERHRLAEVPPTGSESMWYG